MKFGLFIALLVLLASINVFGQDSNGRKGRGRKTGAGEAQNININVDGDRGTNTVGEKGQDININVDGDHEIKTDGEEGQDININVDGGRRTKTVGGKGGVTETKVTIDNTVPAEQDEGVRAKDIKKTITVKTQVGSKGDSIGTKTKPSSTVVSVKTGKDSGRLRGDKLEEEEEHLPEPVDGERTHSKDLGKHVEVGTEDETEEFRKEGKPGSKVNVSLKKKLGEESREENEESDRRGSSIKLVKPTVELSQSNDKVVRVRGSILLVKYASTLIEAVNYDSRGARFGTGHPTTPVRALFANDFIARRSRVTLYVSTTKTTDPKLALNAFPIKFQEDHFPLSFDINVELPNQQRGLLQRADITLYFFAYVNNLETRVDTFVPAGTSQILLQGTNQLVQTLDVYVKASGIEISGLFRGRFGSKYIRTGTSYQVFIVPQQSLPLLRESTFESVAQLTLNNLPSMLPVPFSMLVNNQILKSNTKYFAIAYIIENGVRRLLNQAPIWVINEQKTLVTPQVNFNVVPSPFMLEGNIISLMPGLVNLQPLSKLILSISEIDSNSPDSIFKLPNIVDLPQRFQVNISSMARFDSSKRYAVSAVILDEKNNVYMSTSQPVPILNDIYDLNIPVENLLHYVSVSLHSSSNQPLSYIPGSVLRAIVSETPDTPSKPIASLSIDSISPDFREFQMHIPAKPILSGKNFYLIMFIEINGMITHVSKTLLISNKQPPPRRIQLPVLSLNLITGNIFDLENRPSQWSSSSYATVYLLDSKIENPENAIVQSWKIHLENKFPVHFEALLDFGLLRPNRVYRLQASIQNGQKLFEYKPAGSVLVINSAGGIINGASLPVTNVKTSQLVQGLIYINDFQEPLAEKGVIVVQLSSSPSLLNPSIIQEMRIPVEGLTSPIPFKMDLPLTKIDINAVYYFLVQYIVHDKVIIPCRQLFAISPRNDAKVTITLSKTPQIPISGTVRSTGGPLVLPKGAIIHVYITNSLNEERPVIFGQTFIEASSSSANDFTMNIDAGVVQQKTALYLRTDILYKDKIILSIPKPALLQITLGAQWNINLVIDLPTVIVGRIVSMNEITKFGGNLDVLIEFFDPVTKKVVVVRRIRLGDKLPLEIRLTIENSFFIKYQVLQARAVVKNCKDQVIFQSGSTANIELGLNVDVNLSIVITDQKELVGLEESIDETAPMKLGKWSVSAVGLKRESDFNTPLSFDVDLAQK